MIDSKVNEYMRAWLREYINENCIVRVKPGEPLLPGRKSGVEYSWQFYLRRGLFNSKFLNYTGCLFWNIFADKHRENPFQIAGLETGSTPLIVGLTMTAPLFDINVNSFSIRSQRKTYGLKNIFEGIVDPDMPVLIVDDLSNSKETIHRARAECKQESLTLLDDVFTVVHKDYYSNYVVKDGINYYSLFGLNNFDLSYTKYALINNPITEQLISDL